MAAYHGRTGQLFVAGSQVGELTAWSYSETAEETEAPAMGLSSKRYLAGLTEAGGSFTVNFDPADSGVPFTGGSAVEVGDNVQLILFPRGTGVGVPSLTSIGNDSGTGTVVITGVEYGGDVGSVVTRTFTFRNNLVAA